MGIRDSNHIEKQLENGLDLSALARLSAQNPAPGGQEETPAGGDETVTVKIPKAQLEDLNQISGEWGKIIREMGGTVRAGFRETRLEPGGDGCLCIVFSDINSYKMCIRDRPDKGLHKEIQISRRQVERAQGFLL